MTRFINLNNEHLIYFKHPITNNYVSTKELIHFYKDGSAIIEYKNTMILLRKNRDDYYICSKLEKPQFW